MIIHLMSSRVIWSFYGTLFYISMEITTSSVEISFPFFFWLNTFNEFVEVGITLSLYIKKYKLNFKELFSFLFDNLKSF